MFWVVSRQAEVISVFENRIKVGKKTLPELGQNELPLVCSQRSPVENGFSCIQPTSSDSLALFVGDDRRGSIEWIIMRLIKARARIASHARYWQVHIASAFPLHHHYRAVLGRQH